MNAFCRLFNGNCQSLEPHRTTVRKTEESLKAGLDVYIAGEKTPADWLNEISSMIFG